MSRKWTQEIFNRFVVENSNCKLISEVISYKKNVELICECGEHYKTTIEKFVTRNKRQCNECGRQKTIEGRRYTIEFVKDFVENHSNCSLLSNKYVSIAGDLSLKCGCGTEFKTCFDYFKNGNKRTCNKCAEQQRRESLKYSYNEVKSFIENKGCKLISDVYFDVKRPLNIQCSCGGVFETSFDNFKSNKRKVTCDKCSGKQSKGETAIEEWLKNNQIPYQRQYRFPDCKYKKPLPFDFAVFDNNENLKLLIEYDGEQHFHPYRFKDNRVFEYKKLLTVKERDGIKTSYCATNNIKLVRIPYTQSKFIPQILKNTLS